MTKLRYFVAKFIPDLQRFEPRNIGIVVWTPDQVSARFAGERLEEPGEVDRRRVPDFVSDTGAFAQWVQFWRRQLAQEMITDPITDTQVARESPLFLDALASTSRGSFVLTDGGFALDEYVADEVSSFTDYLYNTLVDAEDDIVDTERAHSRSSLGSRILLPIKRKLDAARIGYMSNTVIIWSIGEFFCDLQVTVQSVNNYIHAFPLDRMDVSTAVNEASGFAHAAEQVRTDNRIGEFGFGAVVAKPLDDKAEKHYQKTISVLLGARIPILQPDDFEASSVLLPLKQNGNGHHPRLLL